MSILELVVVVCAVACVLSLILNFIMYTYINSMRVHITQLHAGLGSMLGKILGIEQLTAKLAGGMTEFIDMTGELVERIDMMVGNKQQAAYRTADGKYSASTLEELINKIREDQASDDYFSDDDIKKLRDLFEDDDEDEEED